MRRLLQVCAWVGLGVGAPLAHAQPVDEPPAEEGAEAKPDTPYERHMKNGVKLFREQNWDGAIAEFEAAYRSEPKASPLINLALTYKRLNNPAKAIDVLEQALADHEDTMPPDQLAAAKKEIGEMRALLAYVTVTVTPPQARLFVDDRPVTAGELALSPGTRVFRAEADGYEPREAKVRVASGRENAAVSLALEPTMGNLVVTAEDEDALIEIDGREVGRGRWEGSLRPGMHVVRVIVDDEPQRLDVMIEPGEGHAVEQLDGELVSEAAVPGEGDDDDEGLGFGPPQLDLLQGFYFMGSGAILTAAVLTSKDRPGYEVQGSNRFGAAGSLAVGYRVATWAGFEVFGQYSDVRTDGVIRGGQLRVAGDPAAVPVDADNTGTLVLSSVRFGGLMRLLLPGRSKVRFVGRVGGGAVYDRLRFDDVEAAEGFSYDLPPGFQKTDGFGFFAKIDLGAELEYQNVLFDLMIEHAFQTTKHFDIEDGPDAGENAFQTDPILVAGISLGIGYGIW